MLTAVSAATNTRGFRSTTSAWSMKRTGSSTRRRSSICRVSEHEPCVQQFALFINSERRSLGLLDVLYGPIDAVVVPSQKVDAWRVSGRGGNGHRGPVERIGRSAVSIILLEPRTDLEPV